MSTTPRNNRRRKSSLLSKARWAGYAAAGAATALGTYEAAEAEIWWSKPLNNGLGWELNAEAKGSRQEYTVELGGQNLLLINTWLAGSSGYYGQALANLSSAGKDENHGKWAKVAGVQVGPFVYDADRFAYKSAINAPERVFNYFGTMASNNYDLPFKEPGSGYLGFSFGEGTNTQFGWVRVEMLGGPGNAFKVMEYAYGGIGESIYAGQTESVPEPGSLGLLAVGGVGLLLWRRKRRQNQTIS